MPETMTVLFRSMPLACMATVQAENAVPIPHPGHQM
jgi:hypothetical protein